MNCNPGVTNKKLPVSLPLSVMHAEYCPDPGLPYLLNIFQVHSFLTKAKQEVRQCPWEGLWLNVSCGLFPHPGCWSEVPAAQALGLVKTGRRHCL